MPDLLTDEAVGISNVLSDADVGIASSRGGYDYLAPLPPITAEQLGEEHVSHPALPIPATRVAPPAPVGEYDYLQPLPPLTTEQLAEPPPSPSLFQRFNKLFEPGPVKPSEMPMDESDRAKLEDAVNRVLLGERIQRVEHPIREGTRESVVQGVKTVASPAGLAVAGAATVAPQVVIPGLLTKTIADAPEVISKVIEHSRFGDDPNRADYYKALTDAAQTGLVIAGTGRYTSRLPRSFDAWRESVAGRAEARFEAAKNITPRPPLQIPERFVESPLPEIKLSPPGGPSAVIDPQAAKVYEPVSPKPVEGEQTLPTEEGGLRVPTPEEAVAKVPLDTIGNAPEFYSLPRLRALERSNDPRIAAAKKYYGAKTVPDLARLAKARFDEMAAKAKPLETREDAEMKRVQALPEGPEGEAQLVAEDIAKSVETVDVSDVAGVSPVPALVRIIRRAARDPAMKTAAEQAMQKIGAAAREQGVPLDTIKQEIAGELKAIYGADAAEMAKAFFGEEIPIVRVKEATSEQLQTQPSGIQEASEVPSTTGFKRESPPQVAQPLARLPGEVIIYRKGGQSEIVKGTEYILPGFEEYQTVLLKPSGSKAKATKLGWRVVEKTTGFEISESGLSQQEAITLALQRLRAFGKPAFDKRIADYRDAIIRDSEAAIARRTETPATEAPKSELAELDPLGLTPAERLELDKEVAANKAIVDREWPPVYKKIQEASGLSNRELEELGIYETADHPSDVRNIAHDITANAPGGRMNKLYDRFASEGHTGRFLWGGTADAPRIGFDPDVPGARPDPVAARKAWNAVNAIRGVFGHEPLPDFFKGSEAAHAPEAKPAPAGPVAKAQAEVPSEWQATARGRDVYKADVVLENAKDEAVVLAMKAAPSYPKLLAAYHRFRRSLSGKSYDPSVIEKKPWKMLDSSSGVMNAKSQTAKTLARLENAVFAETGLPRKAPSQKFRGGTGVDWEKVSAGTPPEAPIPPGPGAASPSEFAERTAKGAGEEPPKGPPQVAIDAGAKPTPEVARKAKDFNLFNKANSGQWTFYFGKLGEAAKSAWDKMTLSAFKIREDVGRDTQRYVDNLLAELPREIRRKGGKVFFDALDGKAIGEIESEWTGKPHGEAVIAAARQVKSRLEEIRTTIRDTKRESYNAFLMGLDRSTLAELFDNNISRSIDTSKYTKEQFSDALTRNEFPDDWGIADGSYLTHLFTGTWKVTAKLGETTEFVTRAKTVAEAKAQVFKRVKENPDYAKADWKIEQDTVIPADMIRLGDRRFWNLVQRMKDNLGVTASEVKQAQQGIIGRKASKQKWFGSLQQRRGFQGYSHDFRQTMTSYLSGFHRWLELTKLNREVQPLIEQVRREGRTSAAEQLDILMENLWGKPAQSTVLFDNFIREMPVVRDYIKPLALDRWSRNIRSTLAFLTLKTVRFAVVNRLQPLQGLYPLVGERILAQAKIRQHTAEGRALLDEAGVRFDPGQYGGEATSVKSTLRNIGERFSGERSNQELAFLAMYQHGTESGLSKPAAIDYAKLRGQLLTQFTPVITDIPPIMRGPITGLLFQFKRFPIKQAELLFKMVAQRQFGGLARWLGVMAAAGGLSYFMRQFLVSSDKRERLRRSVTQQHGQAVADAVMYGAPSLMNTDLSGSLVLGDEPFGANIYEKIGRQVTGPAVSLTAEGIKAALAEPRESTTALQKAITTLRRFPTLKPIAELIALEQSDLDVRTPDGEVKYRKAVKDAVVGIGAFRTANEANMQSAVNAIVELKRQTTELKNAAYVAAISNGNIEPALEAIQKFNERWPEVAISSKELNEYIHTRAKASGKTDYERQAGKKFAPLLPEQP